MRVLVNALSVTNLSGRHVLLGHLAQLARWTVDQHEFVVLYHMANRDIRRNLGVNVTWIQGPTSTGHWTWRTLWEQLALSRKLRELRADILFSPAGTAISRCPVPQVVFAQNPWCLVPGLRRGPMERVKTFFQRRAYRHAMRGADMMVFNSEFMRRAYRENAGADARAWVIAHNCIDDETHESGARRRNRAVRRPCTILSVSAMASHKGVETVIDAVSVLRREYDLSARLVLVGAWPDRGYARRMRKQVRRLGLEDVVTFAGHVTREVLYEHYTTAKVFCLMSHCESFGLPGVEAQVHGLPVVAANCCAMPDVYGAGGRYPAPDDVQGTARCLAELMTQEELWLQISRAAVDNADRYRWSNCSRRLLDAFEMAHGS